MKLSCLQKNLIQGITQVEKAISRNSTLPILSNILLEIDQGRLKFSATNLELAISSWIGARIEKPGSLTIPARIFSSFVSSLPNKKVDLEIKGASLNIKCENSRASIKGLPAKDFPLIPPVKKECEVNLPAPAFKRALSQVIPAVSISDSRPELSGILFKSDGQELALVATDSYRLAEKKLLLKGANPGFKIIIPQRTALELVKIIGDQEGEIKLIIDENQALFEAKNVEVVTRLIDGNFPDYERIIPEKFSRQAILDLREFISQVKTSAIFSGVIDDVVLSFSKSRALISSESREIGKHEAGVVAKLKGRPLEKMVLNHRYLMDGLNNISSDQLQISFNDAHTPVMLSSYHPVSVKRPKNRDFLYIVMPIKNP